MSNLIRNWVNPIFSALDFDNFPSSIANLPAALTINGITVNPIARHLGHTATVATWPASGYGSILVGAGSGSDPTINAGSPLLGLTDDSIKYNSAKYHEGPTTGYCDIPNGYDAIFEIFGKIGTDTHKFVSKIKNGTNYEGWDISLTGNVLYFRLINSSLEQGLAQVAVSLGTYFYALIAYRHSDLKARIWANGTFGAEAGIFSGSKESPAKVAFGAYTVGPAGNDAQIELFSMYAASGLVGAGAGGWTEFSNIATDRFAKLCGIYPQKALGTALPSVVTRSTAGYLDKVEADGTSKLYYMGANFPRVCSRKDTYGVEQRGYLSETSSQNICLQSQTFATTWTPVTATVPATSVICPDGIARTTCTLHEDGTAATYHYISQNITTTVAQWVFSIYAKAVNRSWIRIQYGDEIAYFNLDAGVVGTISGARSGRSANIIACDNGWYRCYLTWTGIVETRALNIVVAEADNDITFNGLNQDSLYIFGAQVELGNYPSSYIPTTTAAVTRTADALRYAINNANVATGKGSLSIDILAPSYTLGTTNYIWELDEGGNLERIELYVVPTTNLSTVNMRNTAGIQATFAGTVNIFNNVKHTILTTWQVNQFRQYIDKSLDGEDTSCIIPTGMTQLEVGGWRVAGNEANCLVSNIKISK